MKQLNVPIANKILNGFIQYYQPKDEASAYRKRRLSNSKYLLEIKCNYCNHMNELIYQSDKYL